MALLCGCHKQDSSAPTAAPVVLYTSVDEPYVRPLVERFQQRTGIEVQLVTDAEASKSVGLAERIVAERDHPRADVWWDNEVFHTIRLAGAGALAPYESRAAAGVPAKYRDDRNRWAGSVLRVRVIVSSPKLPPADRPRDMTDLTRPPLKGKIAFARPTGGTTGGHVAALSVLWGNDAADGFFRAMHANGVTLVGGNGPAAESVARGDLLAAVCDNDDAASAGSEVGPVNVDLPDQDGVGTLAMPCAVAVVAGCPNGAGARQLVDFLLSPEVDKALIDARFAWCSTRDAAGHGRFMDVDYAKVAEAMPGAVQRATSLMEGR